jgi:hypothetical protein
VNRAGRLRNPAVYQRVPAVVERTGIEPVTSGLQSDSGPALITLIVRPWEDPAVAPV